MSKKKKIVAISAVLIFLAAVVIFSPSKMQYNRYIDSCDNYCESIKNTPKHSLECELPLGGCINKCLGVAVSETCAPKSKCFESCDATCFGLNASSCSPGIFESKIDFLSGNN